MKPVGRGFGGKALNGAGELVMAIKDRRVRGHFADFSFLNALIGFFFGTPMEPKPIPVKAQRRR